MVKNWPGKLAKVSQEELLAFDPRVWMANTVPRLLPARLGGRVRTALYRLFGVSIGPNTLIAGAMTIGPSPGSLRRLRFGAFCFVNSHVFVDASAQVTVGDGVAIGHHVTIITATHDIGPSNCRAGALTFQPVCIDDGAWIAARVTLLPGVTVGAGAVVAAGAVVTRDVPPNTLVGGVPARTIRQLSSE